MQVRTPRFDAAAAAGNPRGARLVFAAAIVAAGPLSLCLGLRLAASVSPAALPATLLGVAAGALAADLVSGMVHWACDTWGSERTRWLGPTLIRSFREHHRNPRAMLDHDWIEVNGEVALAASAAFLALRSPGARALLAGAPFLAAFAWSLISVGALANQFHQWSHMPAPPPLVRSLQRRRWILSHARHARHHRAPHTDGYCIATGWLNGALDAAGFWRTLERVVRFTTGAVPRQEDTDGVGRAAARRAPGRSPGCQ